MNAGKEIKMKRSLRVLRENRTYNWEICHFTKGF